MQKKRFGLVGKNISYSFSKAYFTAKFEKESRDGFTYENFDIAEIENIKDVFKEENLGGLNVTIPYKETIIPYVDALSETAAAIGAVNTIAFENGKTIGHNTDYIGFRDSLMPLLTPFHQNALILGTGGASKAVAYALQQLGITYAFASSSDQSALKYEGITESLFSGYQIIINATPLGTSPNTDACPSLPYQAFSPQQIAYDLIYNPAATLFLKKASAQGAVIKNGHEMLVLQAEAAWKIWNR